MHTNHAVPACRAAILGAALALADCTPAAAQTSAKPAVTRVHGTAHLVIYSVNSDGPDFRVVLSGAIGDYGPAVAVYPDGKVDPEHDSELELKLSRGTFRLNIAGLVLRLLFSDGTAGDVDFSGERWTGVLSPLNDPAYFAEVTVDPEAGTIVWPGGIDLAPEPLYEQAKAHPLLAA
jgi:hypothetical protein